MGGLCRSRSLRFNQFLNKFVMFWIVLTLVGVVQFTSADRTFTKVYEPIFGTLACFKRLNGTHEIGCRSSARGDVGVLHLIEGEESLKWVLKDGPHAPYIAIVNPVNFTRSNLIQFRNSGRVKGVLLLVDGKSALTNFSTDSTCPNEQFNFYSDKAGRTCSKWNENGNSLLFENFNFPIFYVKNETNAEKVLNCYETFNRPENNTEPRSWPLCAAELKSFMMAAVDTPTCIRRSDVISINRAATKVCDPLGDQNIWATLYPQNKTSNQSRSAIVVAARIDGASLFDEMSPSADSSVTGLVTLLAVIKHLSSIKEQLLEDDSSIDNVYFMLFNGESFGYIGSSRVVYDMRRGEFPLKLEEIKYFVEINQVALKGSESYYIHQTDSSQTKEFTDILTEQAVKQNLAITTLPKTSNGVPPSSIHSFLREHPNLTGVVISNYNQKNGYRNQFYNSIFDNKDKVDYNYGDGKKGDVFSIQQKLASLSAAIANSIREIISPQTSNEPAIEADLDTIDELLHCYLETSNCSIFRNTLGIKPGPGVSTDPYPLYVGVATYTNTLTQLTKYLIVTYLGTQIENITKEDECWKADTPGPHYFINGTCWDCPIVNTTEAKSPAFLIPNYDWSSGKYSTWSESVWQKFSVRVFLKPSLFHEVMTLVSGILVLIVSMVFVRFVNDKADTVFPSRYAGYLPVPHD